MKRDFWEHCEGNHEKKVFQGIQYTTLSWLKTKEIPIKKQTPSFNKKDEGQIFWH